MACGLRLHHCITDRTAYLQSMRRVCRQLCSAARKSHLAQLRLSCPSRYLRCICGRCSLPADAGRQRPLRACRRLCLRSLASFQPWRPPTAQAHDCHIIVHRLVQAPGSQGPQLSERLSGSCQSYSYSYRADHLVSIHFSSFNKRHCKSRTGSEELLSLSVSSGKVSAMNAKLAMLVDCVENTPSPACRPP